MTGKLGWPYPLRAQPWPENEQSFAELEERNSAFSRLRAIAASGQARGASDDLAGFTAGPGTNLMVRSTPVPLPPYDIVAVRISESMRQVRIGTVLIEHISTTGHDERLSRPLQEAVPLFWRSMIER
jgi:hypothetical protein